MKCRISNGELSPLIDLGNHCISDFPTSIKEDAPRSPLKVGMGSSGLVQLFDTPDQDALYKEYWYRSGTNASMKKELTDIVESAKTWVKLEEGDTVLDIGCNDGTLLKNYHSDIHTVGFDPAQNLAEQALYHAETLVSDYFTAEEYKAESAKIITSIAMFYDLPDPRKFLRDIKDVLHPEGIWVVQMSYTPLMLKQNAFDNICHEHLEYYTFETFFNLVHEEDFRVLDVELNTTNGGSFRVYLDHPSAPQKKFSFEQDVADLRVESLWDWERNESRERNGFSTHQPYLDFAFHISRLKDQTLSLLTDLKSEGKKVYGYGASTKGNTLLQYYGIGPDLIEKIADKQVQKWGHLTAGSWIPITGEQVMRQENPDYLFVFPWHFIDGFVAREVEFLKKGGRFIVPLPQLEVIDKDGSSSQG